MRDGIIYVRDSHRQHSARDILNAIQLELSPGDSATLNEVCQIIEDYIEKVSHDPEWPEDGSTEEAQ